MNFIVEFVVWLLEIWPGLEIHKVDWFLAVFGVLFWFTVTSLSEFGAKQMISIVGYTMLLNTLVILFGGTPSFWWAWGWTFAFIPVFNWWKPMILIMISTIVLMITMYNNGYDKEMDKYGWIGFTVPNGCLDWPCTKFGNPSYYGRSLERDKRKAEEKAAKAAARAKPTPPPAPKPEPVKPEVPLYMPRQMFIPVQ